MRLAAKDGIGPGERQMFRLRRLGTRLYQFLRYGPDTPKTVLLIVGCQRSGTSMLHHFFRLDRDAVTYDEYSPLSRRDPAGLRLDPPEAVVGHVGRDRAPLVVMKPLVESQNLVDLLGWFPDARALWMYRDYREVAGSNVRHFGPKQGHEDLAPIVADDRSDWRAEHLAPADRTALLELYRPDLGAHDAAALFWYARNSLFFGRNLAGRPDTALCRYDELVARPAAMVAAVYGFAGRTYPGDRIVADVISGGGRSAPVTLSAPIAALCDDLLARLDGQSRLGR
jgi:hypothetical protein